MCHPFKFDVPIIYEEGRKIILNTLSLMEVQIAVFKVKLTVDGMTGVAGVNLRTKKKRVVGSEDSQDGFDEPERPMSWEGELSDAEMSVVTGACFNSKQVWTEQLL